MAQQQAGESLPCLLLGGHAARTAVEPHWRSRASGGCPVHHPPIAVRGQITATEAAVEAYWLYVGSRRLTARHLNRTRPGQTPTLAGPPQVITVSQHPTAVERTMCSCASRTPDD